MAARILYGRIDGRFGGRGQWFGSGQAARLGRGRFMAGAPASTW